jgi:hypothetical protein
LNQEMRGHPLEHRRRRNIKTDTIGHLRHEIGWRDAVFGVGADRVGTSNPVADAKRRHPVAHRGHGASDLGAEDKG